MKKILVIMISILVLTGCSLFKSYKEINYSEYKKMLDNNDTFVLYIGSKNCTHCKDFAPTLKKVIRKYDLDVKYIDISKLTNKENAVLKNKTRLQGTPTIVFVEKGKVLSGNHKVQGAVDEEEVIKVFKKQGYIK